MLTVGLFLLVAWPLAKWVASRWHIEHVRLVWLLCAAALWIAATIAGVWLGELYPACKL